VAMNEGVSTRSKFLIVFTVIIMLLFIWIFVRPQGFIQFVSWVALFGFVFGIIGLAVYLFYYLFIKPQKVDITYVNKNKLVDAARTSKSPLVKDLYLSGDEEHSRIRLGKIVGTTHIQVFTDDKGHKVDETVFVVQTASFPLSWFVSPLVIRVTPNYHSQLIGDVVLKGFSLVKHSEYYYLNHQHLNEFLIDYNVLQEAKRGVMFLMLGDLKDITDQAIGVNPRHNLSLEQNKMMKIPQPPVERPAT